MASFEDTKNNYPFKSICIRITVFLKQNNLTAKTLIEKLIATRNTANSNKQKAKSNANLISISFFAKFIKAKVDKKRSLEEIKHLLQYADLDRDGKISDNDLEAALGRVNF